MSRAVRASLADPNGITLGDPCGSDTPTRYTLGPTSAWLTLDALPISGVVQVREERKGE
jgi:hypothetical protein